MKTKKNFFRFDNQCKSSIQVLSALFTLLVLSVATNAQTIEKKTAELVAKNFFYERINQKQTVDFSAIEIRESFAKSFNDQTTLYIVNLSPDGFVIVSASENSIPIIGFSLRSNFDKYAHVPQLDEYLEKISGQIHYIISNEIKASDKISSKWERLKTINPDNLKTFLGKIVEPLLFTTWDQGKYYNDSCPADPAGPGGNCVTGCVATAMGQLVNYFRFPLQGTGSYSYECPPYGILSADFGNTNYIFNQMPDYVNAPNLSVAQLLYHLGVSVDMVYGPNGSGMYNHKAAYSLRTHFNYVPATEYLFRDSTNLNWDSIIVAHLDRKMPMYYAGWSVPNVNGHAFICDGYQDDHYFHFNWGWGGSQDGYFYTDDLTPGGSNFNLAQELIINCFPDTTNYTYPYSCSDTDTLTTYAGTIGDGSGPVYPYENNLNCQWLISPGDSVNFIEISFHELKTDTNDILTVYDGPTTNSPLLGTYSGSVTPDAIESTSDEVLITFESNGSENDDGWLLSWHAEIPVYCSGMSTFTTIADTFSDGSGPRDYHNGTSCLWYIAPAGATEITIEFLEFNTEKNKDKVEIYDGETLIATLSGDTIPAEYTATSGSMFVSFSTNSSVTAPGWKACYTTNLVDIGNNKQNALLKIYPVPTKGILHLENGKSTNTYSVNIFSLTGEKLYNKTPANKSGETVSIDISALKSGVYLLELINKEGILYRKIIKE